MQTTQAPTEARPDLMDIHLSVAFSGISRVSAQAREPIVVAADMASPGAKLLRRTGWVSSAISTSRTMTPPPCAASCQGPEREGRNRQSVAMASTRMQTAVSGTIAG